MSGYVVVDLEMCKVPQAMRTQYPWGRETIQIGAVLLDEQLEIAGQFDTFVAPQFGSIDAEIKKLTGIEKKDVKNAPDIKTALEQFLAWIPEGAPVVSWSDNDEKQIRHETQAKKIELQGLDRILENWIDCQKIFSEKMQSEKCYKLSDALVATDICYSEREHDGLMDAWNTALLFAKMQKEQELQLNPYYRTAREEEEHLKVGIGDLLAGVHLDGKE